MGGTFLLALRRLSGTAGALIILIAGIICSVLLTGKLSLKASAETAGRKAKNIVTYKIQIMKLLLKLLILRIWKF